MKINVEIRYRTFEYPWLCFRHAVQEAMRGIEVATEIDDFSGDDYHGRITCGLCDSEAQKSEEEHLRWYNNYRAQIERDEEPVDSGPAYGDEE